MKKKLIIPMLALVSILLISGCTTMLGQDRFETIQEAQVRGVELGCSGTHIHEIVGETVYMPCETHEEWQGLVGE